MATTFRRAATVRCCRPKSPSKLWETLRRVLGEDKGQLVGIKVASAAVRIVNRDVDGLAPAIAMNLANNTRQPAVRTDTITDLEGNGIHG